MSVSKIFKRKHGPVIAYVVKGLEQTQPPATVSEMKTTENK